MAGPNFVKPKVPISFSISKNSTAIGVTGWNKPSAIFGNANSPPQLWH